VRDLEDEIAGLETRIDRLEQEQKESRVQRKEAELDIQEGQNKIEKYEQQQLEVRNNREYDALTKEIETQKKRISDAESTLKTLEEREEENEQKMEEAEEKLERLEEMLTEKEEELEQVIKETEREQNVLQEKRDEAREQVEPRYLRAYEKLRERMRDGRAVVPLERGAAAGYAVPPQRQVEIRQRSHIIVSEHTGRIIVDADLFKEIDEELEEELD
jgi:predicted  nucleic acid-binding Zn-ribbon protein